MRDLIKQILQNLFSVLIVFGTIASIIGLAIFGVKDPTRANIALGFLCFLLFYITFKGVSVLNSFLSDHYPTGTITDSVFVNYRTQDGNYIEYELYKFIQCKRPLLSEYSHGFCWSGTKDPEISSELQAFDRVVKSTDGTYDKIVLKLHRPLKFNDCETIHISQKIDDADHKSSTHIENQVRTPLKLMRWKVDLKHKGDDYNCSAKYLTKKIDGNFNHQYEEIRTIPFDRNTKSFEVSIPYPEVGYFHRLEWDR